MSASATSLARRASSKRLYAYEGTRAILTKLAAVDNTNTAWKRELSVVHDKFGDLHMEQGKIAAAREDYLASLHISVQLAGANRKNVQWQRDVSTANNKV